MNKKIENTKAKLFAAFTKLAETTDPSLITVTELCRTADVNRTTFYKYYSVPTDIAVEFTEQLLRETYSKIHEQAFDLAAMLNHLCRSYQEIYANSIARRLFFVSSFDDILTRFITQFLGHASLLENGSVYFIAGGLNSMMKQWLLNEPEIPAEEVVKLMTAYTRNLETVMYEERKLQRQ